MAEIAASLPSWNDGPAKAAIVEFVARVTKSGGPGFVPAPERIATFAAPCGGDRISRAGALTHGTVTLYLAIGELQSRG